MKEQHAKEIESVEQSHKETIDLVGGEKEKITRSVNDTVERERKKMEQMHAADLEHKERIFEQNLA
jgi:flavin-binding protein dodecin